MVQMRMRRDERAALSRVWAFFPGAVARNSGGWHR